LRHPHDDENRQDDQYTDEIRNDYQDDDYSSPAGSLYDDAPEDEPSAYVKGFAREEAEEVSFDEEPIAEPPPARTRRAEPRAETPFEMGIRDAANREERRRQSNPTPRPAVRAGTPPRRMAQPPRPATGGGRSSAPQNADQDASYDDFRKRYSPGELISSGDRPERPNRRPASSRNAPPRARAAHPANDDMINPLRWALVGCVGVVLIIMILLIVRLNSVSSQRDDYRAQVESMTATVNAANDVETERDLLDEEVERLEGLLEIANNTIAQLQGGGNAGADPGTGDTPNQGGTTSQPDTSGGTAQHTFPTTHEVLLGQTLSRIAILFYGSDSIDLINHIAAANGITNINNVPAGRVLDIPAPPQP